MPTLAVVAGDGERDPDRAARLLLAEREALLPLLRELPPADADRPTVLPGWSVRDVLAHCSAALATTAAGRSHVFDAAANEADVAERRSWPFSRVLDELSAGYAGAAEVIRAAGGRLDGLALGEWIHGGDVRDALGRPDAWASAGLDDALVLLAERSRDPRWGLPPTRVELTGGRVLHLGPRTEVTARIATDPATLLRVCAGRAPHPERYRLDGCDTAALLMFR